MRLLTLCLSCGLLAAWPLSAAAADDAILLDPVAMAVRRDGTELVVANRRGRSLTVVDALRKRVLRTVPIDAAPADLVASLDGATLWISDPAQSRILEHYWEPDGDIKLRRAITSEFSPGRLAISSSGKTLAVSCLWDSRLLLLPLDDRQTPPVMATLPFPPGELAWLPDETGVVAADAFAGSLAVVRASDGAVVAECSTGGQNLRGLTLDDSGQRLCFTQTTLRPAPTTRDNIESGRLVEHSVCSLALSDLQSGEGTAGSLQTSSRLRRSVALPTINLGHSTKGAADLVATVQASDEEWWTLCSGTGEVIVHDASGSEVQRIPVAEGASRWIVDAESRSVVALSPFTQTLEWVDVEQGRVTASLELAPLPRLKAAERGERLFFSARLSHHGWLSCHSCHPDGHTAETLADTFADGSHGTPKRVLSLLGTRDNNPWGWNGGFRELQEQVRQSVESSMQGDRLAAADINDLVAYLHTLDPPPPPAAARPPAADERLIEAGRELFHRLDCNRCHVPPLTYTSDALYDVGLADEAGLRKFNPPSLVGIGQRRRFFHEGRFDDLRDVFEEESHQLPQPLDDPELESLLTFLRSL